MERWDGLRESWARFDPDLYIGASGHRQPIPPSRRAKVALHVNPYGPIDMGPINESQESIKWVIDNKPDVVFGYGDESTSHYWRYWTERHGIKWVPMPTAGDLCLFRPFLMAGKSIDVAYVGGRWDYKAQNIDQFLFPVLRSELKSKVHGWGHWPQEFNVTGIEDAEVPRLFHSARIAPCISEPHTHIYGIDVPERVFKTILCGALAIHDSALAVKKMIPSAIVANGPKEFLDLTRHYAKEEGARQTTVLTQRNDVLNAHTYHHRMMTLLEALKMPIAEVANSLKDLSM